MGGCCREAGPSLEDQPGSFEVQSAIKQLCPRLELWQIKADLSECEEVKSNRSFHLLMYEYLFRLCPQPCLYRTLTDILTAGANLSWGVYSTSLRTQKRSRGYFMECKEGNKCKANNVTTLFFCFLFVPFFAIKSNAMNLQFCMASRAVKFSPLRGGCLPVGEIKTKNTQYKRAAAGVFGFARLSDRSMGLQ